MAKILFCNNENDMRELIEDVLHLDLGDSVEFLHAEDDSDSILKYSDEVDLIIYDHHRCVKWGEKILEHNLAKGNLPFIFLSGGGAPADFEKKITSANCHNRVLSKPFCLEHLSDIVKKFID